MCCRHDHRRALLRGPILLSLLLGCATQEGSPDGWSFLSDRTHQTDGGVVYDLGDGFTAAKRGEGRGAVVTVEIPEPYRGEREEKLASVVAAKVFTLAGEPSSTRGAPTERGVQYLFPTSAGALGVLAVAGDRRTATARLEQPPLPAAPQPSPAAPAAAKRAGESGRQTESVKGEWDTLPVTLVGLSALCVVALVAAYYVLADDASLALTEAGGSSEGRSRVALLRRRWRAHRLVDSRKLLPYRNDFYAVLNELMKTWEGVTNVSGGVEGRARELAEYKNREREQTLRAAERLRELSPPDELAEAHQLTLGLLEEEAAAADAILSALDKGDTAGVSEILRETRRRREAWHNATYLLLKKAGVVS